MEKTITKEEYEKAIDTLNKYRIENIGFYAKMKITKFAEEDANKRSEIRYYDDLFELANDANKMRELEIGVHNCVQITREEFEKNHLPY